MIFYFTLFLFFLYLKVARVHKKEEKMQTSIAIQHLLVFGSAVVLYMYGLSTYAWYFVVVSSFLFFIIAALIVTAVQLGIFIDGKPQFGISKVYKFFPLLSISIMLLVMKLALF